MSSCERPHGLGAAAIKRFVWTDHALRQLDNDI
jgi:hypothetical protein